MNNSNFKWLDKRTPRSVDQLKLWPKNPRLNPEESHIYLSDFVEDIISEESDKKQFFKLIKSIAEEGFISADPVVVWKNTKNNKFYVAEGNRRVLALKLLLNPQKSPKSIRAFIRTQSKKIVNRKNIEKILVSIAPTFEDAEWYINQRNSTSSLQQPWSRVQQQRWISELYEKYNGDIEKITSITQMTKGELENFIKILRIKDLVKLEEVKSKLNEEEYQNATSYKFPITILERFFSNKEVKDRWGIKFDGIELSFINKKGFLDAYAYLIKNIVTETPEITIDTRTITTNLEEILTKLPAVNLDNQDNLEDTNVLVNNTSGGINEQNTLEETNINTGEQTILSPPLKNNPNRSRLILDIYSLNSDSNKLKELFEELQQIPFRYKNCIGVSLRVFLDLAIFKYIESEGIGEDIKIKYNKTDLKSVNLKQRLEYLKQNKLNDKTQKIVNRLLLASNEFSLDVLNGYVHSQDSHYLDKQFLNRFWDFLFPLFEILLDIKEK